MPCSVPAGSCRLYATGATGRRTLEEDPDGRLIVWVIFWGHATVWAGTQLLGQPAGFLIFALAGVRVRPDQPVSRRADRLESDFFSLRGYRDPHGHARPEGRHSWTHAGTALLVAISVGSDMQQDRSTGRRLGTSAPSSFRYQVAGIVMGAISAVAFAKVFMAAYPVLLQDQTVMSASEQPVQWPRHDL